MLHAASLRNSGKLDEAETLLRKAMESIRQPDEHGARFLDEYGLASIFMERKNWREAQSRLISAQPPAEMRRFCRGFITLNDEAKLRWAVQATIEATRTLVKEGFIVLPYTSDDVVVAKRLLDAGASAIMPLGAPIGSGLGIQNSATIRILREMITDVPLIVDAGVGTASDATVAMELGADAVLMNTAIANAEDPVLMAEAMHHAVLAGRSAYLAGRMPKKLYATASSPLEGVVR